MWQKKSVSPGSTTTRCLPNTTCLRPSVRVVFSLTTTTTAEWISIWSTAVLRIFFTPKTPLKNALYHNNPDGTFTDVTDKAGVAGGTFGMGAAAADYDGD